MSNPQPISLDDLVIELQRLCQEKLSGTLFISGDNHRMAQISLLDGNIMALSCLSKRGAEALRLIRQINPSWLQFIKGSSITTDPDLPPTTDILNSLASALPASPSASSGLTKHATLEIFPQQTRTVLKETLAEFMGPVAPMICNKILQQAQNLDSAIDLLAQEIPDRQQALKFKNKIKQKLF
jgi:hypothetical protein